MFVDSETIVFQIDIQLFLLALHVLQFTYIQCYRTIVRCEFYGIGKQIGNQFADGFIVEYDFGSVYSIDSPDIYASFGSIGIKRKEYFLHVIDNIALFGQNNHLITFNFSEIHQLIDQ